LFLIILVCFSMFLVCFVELSINDDIHCSHHSMHGGGKNCCDVILCCHCQMGHQYYMVNEGVLLPTPQPKMSMTACFCSIIFDLCCMGTPITTCMIRGTLRQRFNIMGGCCGDCICSFFCAPCTLCQNYRELSVRGYWCGGACCVDGPYRLQGGPMPAPMY